MRNYRLELAFVLNENVLTMRQIIATLWSMMLNDQVKMTRLWLVDDNCVPEWLVEECATLRPETATVDTVTPLFEKIRAEFH